MQRIITIIGPESTGKSDLTAALSEKMDAVPVWEYARAYLLENGEIYADTDLWNIAAGQMRLEEGMISAYPDRDIIMDTNMEVIKVWSESAFGYCPEFILRSIAGFHTDLYLLMDIDMPWSPDPLREHPEPHQRQYFFNIYKDIVINSGFPFGIVSGIGPERLDCALKLVSSVLH